MPTPSVPKRLLVKGLSQSSLSRSLRIVAIVQRERRIVRTFIWILKGFRIDQSISVAKVPRKISNRRLSGEKALRKCRVLHRCHQLILGYTGFSYGPFTFWLPFTRQLTTQFVNLSKIIPRIQRPCKLILGYDQKF